MPAITVQLVFLCSNFLMSAFKGEPFPNVEIITGKRQVASPSFDKTFLFGKCACAANKGNSAIKKAIKFNSCPPSLEEVTAKFREEGIEGNAEAYLAFRHFLLNRYKVEDGFDLAFFKEQEL